MRELIVAAAIVVSSTDVARGDDDIWQRAIATPQQRERGVAYALAMTYGDEYVMHAASAGFREQRGLFHRAIQSYTNASTLRPDAAEPHYRLGMTRWTFRLSCKEVTSLCTPGVFDPVAAAEVVRHWRDFTRLAPLDPRGTALLFDRAILHTRLAGVAKDMTEHLELARQDYEMLLDRTEGSRLVLPGASGADATWGNLAETYMMLGRLDDAIAAYRIALDRDPHDATTMMGLAVALDRRDKKRDAVEARRLIAKRGAEVFDDDFMASVRIGSTFYVPDAEALYYVALGNEALGRKTEAIAAWDRFIESGVHPRFQARARQHRAALGK